LTRRFASHAEAMGAVGALEAAGFTPEEITLVESAAAERAGAAATPGGSEVTVSVADQARLARAAGILDGRGGTEEASGSVLPKDRLGRTAAGGGSGRVLGHALSGTGPRPGGAPDDLAATTAADRRAAGERGPTEGRG
jgi:hypothetical protein